MILAWNTFFGALEVVLGVFVLYMVVPWAAKSLLRKRFLNRISGSECVCLTFDDGPDPRATPEILRLLSHSRVRATFFLLGQNVEKYPHLVLQMVQMGHEVGDHGYRHTHPWRSWPFGSLHDLIRGAQAVNAYVRSGRPLLVRPPYGKLNVVTLLYVLICRKRLAFWDIDPKDYEHESPELVVRYVRERVVPGSIVLLHDGRRNGTGSPHVTVSAVGAILEEMVSRGFRFATVSESLRDASRKRKGALEQGRSKG
ncbi:MAG TPA: polysaccharide deacetylase family protein [Acidobacteriota bacterium]|nr:polysaccharide deacetylase family protein [Acidobacteriota bacterium]